MIATRTGWPAAADLVACKPIQIEKPIMIGIGGDKFPLALQRVETDERGLVRRFFGILWKGADVCEFDSGDIALEHRLPRDQYPAVHT